MKLLVIGASGFLGKSVVSRLMQGNHNVVGTYSSRATSSAIRSFKYTFPGDSLERNLADFDAAIVTARLACNDAAFSDSFKSGFVRLISQLTEEIRLRKIVYISSDAVFSGRKGAYSEIVTPDPTTEYGRQHYAAEQIVAELAPSWVIVRTSYLCGYSPDDGGDGGSRVQLDKRWQRLKADIELDHAVLASTNIFKSPIDVKQAADLIAKAATSQFEGVLHAAAPRLNVLQFMKNGLSLLGKLDKAHLLKADNGTQFNDTSLVSVRTDELLEASKYVCEGEPWINKSCS